MELSRREFFPTMTGLVLTMPRITTVAGATAATVLALLTGCGPRRRRPQGSALLRLPSGSVVAQEEPLPISKPLGATNGVIQQIATRRMGLGMEVIAIGQKHRGGADGFVYYVDDVYEPWSPADQRVLPIGEHTIKWWHGSDVGRGFQGTPVLEFKVEVG